MSLGSDGYGERILTAIADACLGRIRRHGRHVPPAALALCTRCAAYSDAQIECRILWWRAGAFDDDLGDDEQHGQLLLVSLQKSQVLTRRGDVHPCLQGRADLLVFSQQFQ